MMSTRLRPLSLGFRCAVLVSAACGKERIAPGPPPPAPAPPGEGYAVTADSVRLWYRVVGSGPETVIAPAGLYHGRSLDPLASNRRLVLYDPRGRGRSDTVPPSKVSLDRGLLDLEAIRVAVRADSFGLIGWSGGGLELFVYALRNPGRVTRLVQLTPLPPRREPYLAEIAANARARTDSAAQARLDAQIADGVFRDRQADLCREMDRLSRATRFGDTALARLAPDVCDWPNEWPERNARLARAALGSLWPHDWRDSLARVAIPRLVIHGERDIYPLEGSREWVVGQSNARLLVIRGAGHWPHYERPAETLGSIDQFLRGQWPPGADSVGSSARSR
jgi:pimeloyl-ACP methyl ester carboxylesterase